LTAAHDRRQDLVFLNGFKVGEWFSAAAALARAPAIISAA
jgi:hypothetical protein